VRIPNRLAALAALALPLAAGCGGGSPTGSPPPSADQKKTFEEKMAGVQEKMRAAQGGGAGATGKAP
jgi:hypothetical protein